MEFIDQFISLALIHLLAVMSPGPDFALVMQQTLAHGRKTGIETSLGIGTGILLHVVYSFLGIGLLIMSSPLLFTVMKVVAALYLFSIGVRSLGTKKSVTGEDSPESIKRIPTFTQAFVRGFLTNALNPKATLFFLAIFTTIVDMRTLPVYGKVGCGLYLALATFVFFTLLSCLLSNAFTQRFFDRWGHWFARLMGGLLIFFGLKIVLLEIA